MKEAESESSDTTNKRTALPFWQIRRKRLHFQLESFLLECFLLMTIHQFRLDFRNSTIACD
eukprot:scaffold3648_cov98-Cylindrotheca_fusiformis.AAC.2